jgi:DNA-binding winged helix-turn-helix (wHTH) protein
MAGYVFGPFELDVSSFELRRGGAVVPLQKKAFDLLLYLVRDAERVVDRDELRAQVWAGTAVTPTSLTRTVCELRSALGEAPDNRGSSTRYTGSAS